MMFLPRLTLIVGLLIGSCSWLMADDVKWTLNDVVFSNGNTATGYFVTDYSAPPWAPKKPVWSIVSFSINVSGPQSASADAFSAAVMASSYLPGEIGIAASGWSKYVDLYLGSNLTTSGGIIPIDNITAGSGYAGYDCGNGACGTLLLNAAGPGPTLNGDPLPEPSPILLLVVGSVPLAISLSPKRLPAA